MPVNTPALRVRDDASGGTATATVSGSTAGTTNTVYGQEVVSSGSGSWVSLGSLTGDGELSIDPGTGYFWFHVRSTDGSTNAVSNLVYRRVSSGIDSPMDQAHNALVARFQQVELDGIPRERIYKQGQLLLEDRQEFPAVVVSLYESQEEEGTGTNVTDEIGYPFTVIILDSGEAYEADRPKRNTWRHQLMKAVINQKLPGINAKTVKVTPGLVIGSKPDEADVVYSAFKATVIFDEERGLV